MGSDAADECAASSLGGKQRRGRRHREDSHEHEGIEVLNGVQRGLGDFGLAAELGPVLSWGEEWGRLVNFPLSRLKGGSTL